MQFYYSYKYNRFWKVIANILNVKEPVSVEEKTELLLKNNIALWDVIQSCDIVGSSDNTISNVKVNDLTTIIRSTDIKIVFTNGRKANELYNKYLRDVTGIDDILLPSTSPANASYSLDNLIEKWSVILNYIK